MRKVFICAFGIILFSDSPRVESYLEREIVRPEYSIGTTENPNARFEYEFQQVVDPKTGSIPRRIRQKEISFSRNHKSRSQFELARSGVSLQENWESVGPFNVGGRTRAVAIDVSDPTENTIIAGGVSGGIWKSTNGGQSWRRTSDPELRNSVTCLVQDTREGKENIWYYGTGELLGNSARGGGAPYRGDGIFKSIDGGESWFQIESTNDSDPTAFSSQFQYSWRIIIDETDLVNDVVILASYGGILKSMDGGDSWNVELGVPLNGLPDDTDLNDSNAPFYTDIIQTEEGYFYAYVSDETSNEQPFVGGGLYFSQDADTWYNISGITSDYSKGRGVMDAFGDDLYFFFNSESEEFLFKSTLTDIDDFGIPSGNWSNLTPNLPDFDALGELEVQGGYNMMIRIMPSNSNVIILGGTNLYRSTDGFSSTNNIDWIGGYNSNEDGGNLYPGHHPDQHDLLFFETNKSKVLSVNDGGIQISNNILADEVQWVKLNNGFITSQFYTVDIQHFNEQAYITGGLQDNGSLIRTSEISNAPWSSVIGGDGGYSASVPLNLHWYFSLQNSQIYRITFGEGFYSFARVDPVGGPDLTGSEYLFINPFVLDPINTSIMYLAGGNTIWKNSNLGQIPDGSQEKTVINWGLLSNTQTGSGLITAVEATINSKYLFYGTSEGAIYRLERPSDREPGPNRDITQSNLPKEAYVACVASNPEKDEEIIAVFSNYGVSSIFHSTNAGNEFIDVSGNLEEFPDGTGNGPSIRWAEIIPLFNGNRYFVGTSVGLYSTNELDGANTQWVKESPDLIGKSVVRMMDYRPLDGKLVVATHGNGVFISTVKGFKSISPIAPSAPKKLKVSNAFPNPFSNVVEIEFEIPETNIVRIDIYDIGGIFVKTLFYNVQFTGTNSVTWDGTNQQGQKVPRGMYFYKVYYGTSVESGRLLYSP